MKFKRLWDLINIEGGVLTIEETVTGIDKRLYLRSFYDGFSKSIYCKLNPTMLELFFQGRITVKEMFLLKSDEDYILGENKKLEKAFISDATESKLIKSIKFADTHFYDLHENIRVQNPFDDILRIVKRDWFNGVEAMSEGRNMIY